MTSHPAELAHAIQELHRPVHDDASLLDLLQRTGHVAVHCVAGVDWCSVTLQVTGAACTAASTGQAALSIDEQQYLLGDGPCVQAMRTRRSVSLSHAELAGRWPAVGAAAGAAGVQHVHALPLSGLDGAYGAINLYSTVAGGLPPDALNFAALLVEYVSRGVADYAALTAERTRAEQLHAAMASRAPIEQAKGILMAAHQVSATEAFDMLRRQSQDSNTKLHRVAAEFVGVQSCQAMSPHAEAPADGLVDYQSAFTQAPAAMLIARPDATIRAANHSLARLLARPVAELVGTSVFALAHTGDLAAMHQACAQLLGGTASTRSVTARLIRSDDVAVPVRITTSKVLDGTGAVAQLVMHISSSAD